MSLDQLKQPRRAAELAGAPRECAAVQRALPSSSIDVLITDRFTAARLGDDWSPTPTAGSQKLPS